MILLSDRLLTLLAHGKYSFPDDTFLLWKRSGRGNRQGLGGGRSRFCVASRRDIVQEAKERFCKYSERAERSMWPSTGMAFSVDEEQGKVTYTHVICLTLKADNN